MRVFDRTSLSGLLGASLLAATSLAGPADARQQDGPVDLTAQAQPAQPKPVQPKAVPAQPAVPAPAAPQPAAASAAPAAAATATTEAEPVIEAPEAMPVAHWTVADAQTLLAAIRSIGAEGLFARDYEPAPLAAAIKVGEGEALDQLASRLFVWLAEDLRDGRTPMPARVQWFAVDPDQDLHPNAQLLAQATEMHDVKGVLASLAPKHPDYALLKDMLTKTKDPKQIAMIRANMDRWRWLAQDLGLQYLMINVPEQELRLTVNNQNIRTYRAIVGKPGKTATPQLAEQVRNVVFNPTWTVPQSIVKGEGLGARLIANPKQAAREGYVATKAADGTITVVQQPGENNALGRVKLDMPNEHAIYIHDTPSRGLFALPTRALSHGCIRAERATELAMTMAILGAELPPETAVEYNLSGKYTKVPMAKPFPVYVTYFTVARDVNGMMRSFNDLYSRDAPVIASFAAPRELHTSQRKSTEAIIKLDNPL
ncbi:L,D-transpeptidase family protein [Novosphingobium sp. KCTC 2891]|uniref:L,D-transpeptidase family protein n=1 Tax=Novosphingobium sp. KCTC 2891 TaxID=2989730 RepID=UPI002223B93C|nr:L,D-transpeptidase family protein [Novosphingobium sp. KCTC 2891]MCW1381998.1 L,D-transpeptidase family protein [Novosphingobium sp. KCTC 2891]